MKKSAIKILALSLTALTVFPNTAFAAKQNGSASKQATLEEIVPPAPTTVNTSSNEVYSKETPVTTTSQTGRYLGKFKTTGYCDSTPDKLKKTASGVYPKKNHTVSADWSVLPNGSKIRIGNSDIVYTVEDTGVYGNWVDIFYDTPEIAHSHGEQYLDIYLVE